MIPPTSTAMATLIRFSINGSKSLLLSGVQLRNKDFNIHGRLFANKSLTNICGGLPVHQWPILQKCRSIFFCWMSGSGHHHARTVFRLNDLEHMLKLFLIRFTHHCNLFHVSQRILCSGQPARKPEWVAQGKVRDQCEGCFCEVAIFSLVSE